MHEYIDVVDTITKHGRRILGLTVVAMVVSAFLSFFVLRPSYEAQAAMAAVPMVTDVTFAPEMLTLSELELGQRVGDTGRRDALVALVRSNAIAAMVLDDIGAQLKSDERNVPDLLKMVQASSKGDLVLIRVRHSDPITAASIANSWAGVYSRFVNDLYGSASESDADITAQVVQAKARYDEAQQTLAVFVGDNRIDTLQREISDRQALLEAYQAARTAVETEPVELQMSAKLEMLADYYGDLREIERWLADAQALQTQVESSSGSGAAGVGNALALVFLRSRALGGSGNLPVQLQVDLADPGGQSVQVADVDALIEVLQARRVETERRIDGLRFALEVERPEEVSIEPGNALNTRIAALGNELLALKRELEVEGRRGEELRHARDLAWGTYQTLTRKQAEVGVASQMPGTVVRLADSAVPPEEPVSPRRLLNTVVAGGIGFLVGVFGALTAEYLNKPRRECGSG